MLSTDGLRGIDGVKVYESYGGNVIFNLCDMPSYELSGILSENDICTRGGLHCAPSAHKKLGTLDRGVVRASFSIMNSSDEIEYFLKTMRGISQKHKRSVL
jgi:selenocysteine lyase/cysteine desulfurase